MGNMRAVVVKAPKDFGVERVEVPLCPARGMLVKVHSCGLCGSDLRTLRRGHHRVQLPWIIGHEVSGTVEEVGRGYPGPYKRGDMLSVAPPVFCGTCEFCRAARPELCEGYLEIGQRWPGGFADYLAVPNEACARGSIFSIPPGLDPAVATIAEPLSSTIHAQEKGNIGLGDTVVVIGAGPVGCMHVALARARGAYRIFLADISQARLDMAAVLEPDALINPAETDLVAEVKKLTSGKGADVVITANAVPMTHVQAVEMAKKGGRILLFGGLPPEEARPGVNMNLVHYNALSLIGTTIFAPRHHIMALSMLAAGRIPGDKLITHRFPLDDFVKGAHLALDGKVIKAVFLP